MEPEVVLVTGAVSGIGRAIALAFARQGARLVLAHPREQAATEALSSELRAQGSAAELVLSDVRHEDDVRRLVDRAVERFGRLDVAVNGAEFAPESVPIAEETPARYSATFDATVLGLLLCLKHEVRTMLPRRRGSIVNVAARPPSSSVEAAAEQAVLGLTRASALDVGDAGIRVNAIVSGTPEEIADAAVFLASNRASFVTGASLRVRGAEVEA